MRNSFYYPVNRVAAYTKFFCQMFCQTIRLMTRDVHSTNFVYLFWRKFCSIAASFRSHIAHIVHAGSEKQMLRVYAVRDVTFVQHLQSFWNWAVMNRPRESMSVLFPSRVSAAEQSVPFVVPARIPIPTFTQKWVSLLAARDLFPKPFDWVSLFWHDGNVAQLATAVNAPFIRG